MVGRKWTTSAQEEYLQGRLLEYRMAAATGRKTKMDRYWTSLDSEFFERWPLLASVVSVTMDPAAMARRISKARAIKDVDALPLNRAFSGGWGEEVERLPVPRAQQRPYRPLEVYARLYKAKIGVAVSECEKAEGVDPDSEEDDDAEDEEAKNKQVTTKRSVAMSRWRKVSKALYEAEPIEVKARVMEEMKEMEEEWKSGDVAEGEDERTPEQYQFGIDQLGEVANEVLQVMGEHTGWHFMLLCGGPMPERSGAISTKSFCYGTTPLGADFQSSHADFKGGVKLPFCQYLKRAFDHSARNARALEVDGNHGAAVGTTGLEGLLTLEGDEEHEEETTSGPVATKRKRAPHTTTMQRALGSSRVAPADPAGETEAADDTSDYGSTASSFALSGSSTWTGEAPVTLPLDHNTLPLPPVNVFDIGSFSGPSSMPAPSLGHGSASYVETPVFDNASFNFSDLDTDDFGSFGGASSNNFDDGGAALEALGVDVRMLGPPASQGGGLPLFDARGEDVVRPSPRPIYRGSSSAADREVDSLGQLPSFFKPSTYFSAFTKASSPGSSNSSTFASHSSTGPGASVARAKSAVDRLAAARPAGKTQVTVNGGEASGRKPTAAAAYLQVLLAPVAPPARMLTPPLPPPPSGPTPGSPPRVPTPPADPQVVLLRLSTPPGPPPMLLTRPPPPWHAPPVPPPTKPTPAPPAPPPTQLLRLPTPPPTQAPPLRNPTPQMAAPPPPRVLTPPLQLTPPPLGVLTPPAPPPTQLVRPPTPPAQIETRPAVNTPKTTAGGPAARGRGRPRGGARGRGRGGGRQNTREANAPAVETEGAVLPPNPAPSLSEEGRPTVLTGAAARAESACVRGEEQRLRKQQNEMLQRLKAMEAQQTAAAAEEKRLAALRRNPAGGADLVLVTRPKRAVKPACHPDGTFVDLSKQTQGEMGRRPGRGVDPNVVQEEQDAELLKKLGKKRKAVEGPSKEQAPAK
ncbi:hypothetical protein C8R45DRAFT_931153 [Mycena sanguinolenta]|nr:hypothetical protein C8R45DRAFT_931153 [Mycena sanguinolenta]